MQAIYPSDHSQEGTQNTQYLCLDMLLAFVNDMAQRADGVRSCHTHRFPDITDFTTPGLRTVAIREF